MYLLRYYLPEGRARRMKRQAAQPAQGYGQQQGHVDPQHSGSNPLIIPNIVPPQNVQYNQGRQASAPPNQYQSANNYNPPNNQYNQPNYNGYNNGPPPSQAPKIVRANHPQATGRHSANPAPVPVPQAQVGAPAQGAPPQDGPPPGVVVTKKIDHTKCNWSNGTSTTCNDFCNAGGEGGISGKQAAGIGALMSGVGVLKALGLNGAATKGNNPMMVKLRQTLGMSSTQDKITNVNIQEKKELMDKMGINPAQAGGAFGLTKKEMAVMAAQEKIQTKAAGRAKRNVPNLGKPQGKYS